MNPDEDTLHLPGGPVFDLVFTNGASLKVGRLMTVFVGKDDAERLRREKYAFDEEILRPYFPMAGVIAGLFELAHRVFGLQVR